MLPFNLVALTGVVLWHRSSIKTHDGCEEFKFTGSAIFYYTLDYYCIRQWGFHVLMLLASDSDGEHRDAAEPHLPRDLGFLRQECQCQLRVCFKQFRNEPDRVQRKREEFRCLPPHEKAWVPERF